MHDRGFAGTTAPSLAGYIGHPIEHRGTNSALIPTGPIPEPLADGGHVALIQLAAIVWHLVTGAMETHDRNRPLWCAPLFPDEERTGDGSHRRKPVRHSACQY